ncbi:unnamed protein product [Schistosoma mattheei]|uniref:Uncharacterized protein n=1 Tax=Schistosoma mattheei TaxID=31246 RepID=A0A183NF63_9TREM|nr:unnamed protein product [Schistosoma mattheei]
MGKASHVTLSLWPRAEPFAYGIFQVHPHPRLAVHNIKKLVTYAKNKSKTGSKLSLFHTCLTMSATQYDKLKDVDERIFTAANSADADNQGGNSMDATLSEAAVEALDLVLEGSADEGRCGYFYVLLTLFYFRTLNSFSELVRIPTILPATGYSKVTHAFHLRGLLSWIRSWLTQNPFSVENCIRNGRRLQWRLPHQVVLDNESGLNNTQQQPQNDIIKRQKIATNAHQVPRTGGHSGNKLVVMSMISRQIIARSSATLDGATLKIHRAHCSYLYLLSPMRSVTLDKCRKLTIVLGPIENTLQLNHCEDCLVIAACRRAVLAYCRRCTLHLAIQSRPILIQPPVPNTISGSMIISNIPGNNSGTNTSTPGTPTPGSVALVGNEEILLAPFHTTYMKLVDHLNKVNLSPKVNYWDRPFLLGKY